MSTFHSQAGKDQEAMVEDYQKALEQIFTYGYGCCAFKHGICGDRLRISDAMSDSANPLLPDFFTNLGWPLTPISIEAKAAEVHMVETVRPVEGVVLEEHG